VLLVTIILVVGIKESARATGIVVLIKLAVILFFLGIGSTSVNPQNWTPFMPQGMAGVGAAAAIVFFAYIGFDAVSTAAEEARNPARDVPIGIIASLSLCTFLYIAVAAVLTGLIPSSQIDIHAPVAEALRLAGFKWGAAVIAIGAVAGITSVLVVMMLGQIRVFFAMSRDRLLGPWLAAVHPRFGTPHRATILTGRARLYQCDGAAIYQTSPPQAVSPAIHAIGSNSRHDGLSGTHVATSPTDVDPLWRLDCHRHRRLFRLWLQAQPIVGKGDEAHLSILKGSDLEQAHRCCQPGLNGLDLVASLTHLRPDPKELM
jgi:hypothetical protein